MFYTTEEQNVVEESGSIMRERRLYFALGVPIGMSSSKNTRSLRLFFLENKNCIWDSTTRFNDLSIGSIKITERLFSGVVDGLIY